MVTSTGSFAIGDSAGCTDSVHTKYVPPALSGTVAELKQSIEATIDERERFDPTWLEKILFHVLPTRRSEWREKERRKILLEALPCAKTQPLIAFALVAGNVEVIEFLLGAGASPNGSLPGRRPVFFDCGENAYLSGYFKQDMKKAILGLKVLLDYGGDLNFVDSEGRTVLTNCRDLELLKFYLSRGADLRANLHLRSDGGGYYTALSLAVLEAVGEHGIRKSASNNPRYNAVERVNLFVQLLGNNSIEGTKRNITCAICVRASSVRRAVMTSRRS